MNKENLRVVGRVIRFGFYSGLCAVSVGLTASGTVGVIDNMSNPDFGNRDSGRDNALVIEPFEDYAKIAAGLLMGAVLVMIKQENEG